MGIKQSVTRSDAELKASGQVKYIEDLIPRDAVHVKVVHSTIANGEVKAIHTEEAEKMPGVICVVTCFDVPDTLFSTAGHPITIDPEHADVKDKKILEHRVRFYGDDVAAVVAETPLQAELAAEKVLVEYEEYVPMLTPEEAIGNADVLHEAFPNNEVGRLDFRIEGDNAPEFYGGSFRADPAIKADGDMVGTRFETVAVNGCHIENTGCFAYMEGKRVVVYSTTQAPMTLRRHIADSNGLPVSDVRVIKPYLGGGFGNKQDMTYEPLAVFLTRKLGGRPVSVMLTREETFVNTRTRHPFDMRMFSEVTEEGEIVRRGFRANANGGAYAAHDHCVAASAVCTNFRSYHVTKEQVGESSTAYTNRPVAAALRGYGIPQHAFALECHTDDICYEHGWDPVDFRLKNIVHEGEMDAFDGKAIRSSSLEACVKKGVEMSDWYHKRKEYDEFNKTSKEIKKGIGMALFTYKCALWPICLETSACRIIMNEDGGCSVQTGAIELGQGSDTVIGQIVSEVLTIPEEKIHVVSVQDTDVAPYDNGAFASRQTYICGNAAKQTALILKEKLMDRCAELKEVPREGMDIRDEHFVDADGKVIASLSEIVTFFTYVHDLVHHNDHITAEYTYTADDVNYAHGCSFVDLEIDVPVGKVKINKIYSVHDSGQILNPKLAEAQVHGGNAMSVGYALGEQLLFDEKGRMLNNNLLDYKMPTSMDIPEIEVAFIETYEPSGPYGAKGLAEPPNIAPAPAIRNAILHATGVAMNKLPMNPQNLVAAFAQAGILE